MFRAIFTHPTRTAHDKQTDSVILHRPGVGIYYLNDNPSLVPSSLASPRHDPPTHIPPPRRASLVQLILLPETCRIPRFPRRIGF